MAGVDAGADATGSDKSAGADSATGIGAVSLAEAVCSDALADWTGAIGDDPDCSVATSTGATTAGSAGDGNAEGMLGSAVPAPDVSPLGNGLFSVELV